MIPEPRRSTEVQPNVALDWLRKEREKAWDQGYQAAMKNRNSLEAMNPYRKESTANATQ